MLNLIFQNLKIPKAYKLRAFVFFFCLAFVSSHTLFAQNVLVKGTVTDAELNEPLPGVNIYIEGTTTGVITDLDGKYQINVNNPNAILVFSFMGYTTQKIAIAGQSVINVKLVADVSDIDEVVVIGYGTVKRSDLTGSIATMTSKEIDKIPVANAAEVMKGRLPGVNVMTVDGSPDAEIVIRVRGGGSITQDNSPLLVVDGFIVGSIRDIPPNDIASFTVLKDAAATAIYGAQAANGVILITTKEPKAGDTKISYNGYIQFKQLPNERRYEVLSPYEYVMAQYEYAKLRSQSNVDNFTKYFGNYDDLELYKQKKPTDWQDLVFGNSKVSQYHNFSINGGTDRTKMNLSLTNNNDEGLLVYSGYKRNAISFKLNHEIAKSLQFEATGRITNTEVNGGGTSGSSEFRVRDAITRRPTNGIADDLEIDLTSVDDEDNYQSFLLSAIDPVELARQNWRRRTTNMYVLNTGLTWSILDNLTYKSAFTTEKEYTENKRYYGPLTSRSKQDGNSLPLGSLSKDIDNSYRWLNTLQYSFKDLGIHDLDFLVGQEIYSNGGSGSSITVEDYRATMQPDEMFANMQLGATTAGQSTYISTEQNRFSLLGRMNYQLMDKYILNATIRSDASSKFNKENRLGIFPAVALAWKMSEEPFLKNINAINELKFRVSYGQTGNDRIEANAFKFLFTANTNNGPGMGTNDYNVYYSPASNTLNNPNLIWETTVNRNVGLDFFLLNYKLNGNIDAYYNTTKDLLLISAISLTSGFPGKYDNIGSTSNKGIEMALASTIIDKSDVSVVFNMNFGLNKSKIEALDGTDERFFQSNWASTDLMDRDDYYFKVGGQVGEIYGYVTDGMYTVDDFESFDSTAGMFILKEGIPDDKSTLGVNMLLPGFLKLKDLNGDSIIDSEDRQVIGNTAPKAFGGFGLDVKVKGFDASILFNWMLGNDVYNTGKIEYNMYYRTTYGNMLSTMSMDNRFTYIDVDGTYTGIPGEIVLDLEDLRTMNEGKELWSGNNSFGTARPVLHSWAIEDGSYLRIQNLTLGYTLPSKLTSKVKISTFRIYATGYNLWLWTKYSGYDPEVSTTRSSSYSAVTSGIDFSSYPRSRSYTFGVNVTF